MFCPSWFQRCSLLPSPVLLFGTLSILAFVVNVAVLQLISVDFVDFADFVGDMGFGNTCPETAGCFASAAAVDFVGTCFGSVAWDV